MESVESVCLEAGWALRLKFIENLIENCIDAETSSAVGSVGSLGSVGPRFALKITALRAKIGSVVPTALIFIFALRAKMSLCVESVESLDSPGSPDSVTCPEMSLQSSKQKTGLK